jgi:hypothetical protein
MEFQTSVIELIRKRRSVRTYSDKILDIHLKEEISDLLQNIGEGPFMSINKFYFIDKSFAKKDHKVKLGTYGFIKGAKFFLAGESEKSRIAHFDYGYLMEKIILHLTGMGLGTCWLGGTFSRSEFTKVMPLHADSIIPAITPLGFPADSLSTREKLIRWGAKADNRMKSEELFFGNNTTTPLSQSEIGTYAIPLEMVRLAPSASNKQPWRIIKIADCFHFYVKRTPGYNKFGNGVDLQLIDLGIAMAHFELVCNELELKGKWLNEDPGLTSPLIDEYCFSWNMEN